MRASSFRNYSQLDNNSQLHVLLRIRICECVCVFTRVCVRVCVCVCVCKGKSVLAEHRKERENYWTSFLKGVKYIRICIQRQRERGNIDFTICIHPSLLLFFYLKHIHTHTRTNTHTLKTLFSYQNNFSNLAIVKVKKKSCNSLFQICHVI